MASAKILSVTFFLHVVLVFSSCPVILQDDLPSISRASAGPHGAFHHHERLVANYSGPKPTSRIVNGVPPTGELRHYVVQLEFDGAVGCTGTLINRRYVLSAAHCNEDDLTDGVRVNFYDEEEDDYGISRAVKRSISHKGYKQIGFARFNDIMLLELAQPAPSSAVPVTINKHNNIPRESAYARAAGFGITHHNRDDIGTLHQVDIPTRSKQSCSRLEPDYKPWMHICAGYLCGGCDTCHADSGGPLFMFDGDGYVYQIGITAYGRGGKCAEPGEPGVYTRVSHYHQWIRNIVGDGIHESDDVKQIIDKWDECPE